MNEAQDNVTPAEIEAAKNAIDAAMNGLFNERHFLRREVADLRQQLEAAKRLKELAEVGADEARQKKIEADIELAKLREELETLKSRQPPERGSWWRRLCGLTD